MEMFGLDAMNIRRIEAGILNAGSDFNHTTNPFEVGLGRFVDKEKEDFIGKSALATASHELRHYGVKCLSGEPLISGEATKNGKQIGVVTAGALSPYLKHGIGYVLLDKPLLNFGENIEIMCRDGNMHIAECVELPFYDKSSEIPRGKLIDIPK